MENKKQYLNRRNIGKLFPDDPNIVSGYNKLCLALTGLRISEVNTILKLIRDDIEYREFKLKEEILYEEL